jgi:SAM-dependent methyltransferase
MTRWSLVRALYRGEGIGRVLMNLEIERTVCLTGLAIDIGGRGHPSYAYLIRSRATGPLLVLDILPDRTIDAVASITRLPLASCQCDTLLCFNVLEHVFDYASALSELRRVLKSGGTLYGRVPFVLGIHGDPSDYWRYTSETLERLLEAAGFKHISIEAQGGLFLVLANLLWPTLRFGPMRLAAAGVAVPLNRMLSALIGERRNRERYPLGYYFTAQ